MGPIIWRSWKAHIGGSQLNLNPMGPISVADAKASEDTALPKKEDFFGLLDRDGRVYTKVVESVDQTLIDHIPGVPGTNRSIAPVTLPPTIIQRRPESGGCLNLPPTLDHLGYKILASSDE